MKNFKSILTSICCLFLLVGNLHSQDVGLTPNELSRMFTPNNIGTEFYLSLPPIKLKNGEVTFDYYGVELYIYSPVVADVEIKVISSQYQLPNGILKVRVNPFKPVIIPQSQLPFQFVAPYADLGLTPEYPKENEFFGGRALYVKSTAPVAVYVWLKNRQYNEGYVAIPKSNTSTEYVIGSSTDLGSSSVDQIPMPSFITIIGQSSIPTLVTANIGGRLGTNSNVPPVTGTTSVQLGEGDVSFIVSKPGGELTGTKLTGNRPFAVLTGNLCAYMPEAGTCNTAIEMPIPTRAWGKNYYIPKMPHSNFGYRQKQTITRVFSKEENTVININNVQQGVLGTNGTQGWTPGSWQELPIDRAAVNNHKGYLISSDKPITVTGYGTSRQDDNNPGNTNPFQLQFVPVEQFQTLQMVGKVNGIYSPYLAVIVTEINDDGSFPTDLEYSLLNNSNKLAWLPVMERSISEKQVFDIPTNGKRYGSMNVNLESQATAFRSSKPFAVYVVAYNSEGAAGYAGSMGLKDLTRANDTRPPRVWITDSSCGHRIVKISVSDQGPNNVQSPIQDPFLNPTFSYNYAITSPTSSGSSGQTNGNYTIEVIDMWKDAEGVFSISDVVGNDTSITFKYIAPDKTPLTDFKDVSANPIIYDQGVSFPFSVKLSNKTVKAIDIQELVLQNKNPNFTINPNQFPRTLQPGETIDVNLTCNALADGLHEDSLGYEICGTKYYFSLLQVRIGTPNLKVGNIAFAPIDAAFGSIQVTKSGTVDFEMRNVGTGIVKIDKNSFTLPTQQEFEVYLKSNTGVLQTVDEYFQTITTKSLRPNEFINVSVVFKPTAAKLYVDSILISSNSKNNDNIARLNGTGTSSFLEILSRFPISSFDWKRCYILEPAPINQAYSRDSVIVLINSGDAPLRILNMYQKSPSPIRLIIPSPAQFLLQPKDSMYFTSTFFPETPGFYTGTFVVVTETDTLEFNINGIGTEPQLLVEPFIQFGNVFISNNNERQRPITYRNRNYEFMDTIRIESISFDTNEIGIYDNFSSKGFASGPTPQSQYPPITLYFPESGFTNKDGFSPTRAQFYVYFSPKVPGTVQAEVVINTGFKKRKIPVILEGTGVELARDSFAILNYSGTRDLTSCLGDSSKMTVNIINSGTASASVNALNFTVDMGEFTTIPVISATNPLMIAPNETKSVTVVWTAINSGSRPIVISAMTGRTEDSSITNSFTVRTSSSPNVSLKLNGGKSVEVGQNIVLSLDNENAFAWDELLSNSITLELQYDKTLLAPKMQLITTPAFANLVTITHQPSLSDATKDVFRITANGTGIQLPVGTMATVNYSTYLPQRILSEGEKNDGIDITPVLTIIPETQNNCIFYVTTATTVTLTPTCAFGLNSVSGSGIAYSLSSMKPDPVTDFGGTIEFSVGLATPVLLDVYNSLGEKVVTLVNQDLQPGTYQVSFPATGFTSGMYTYKLSAGPYVASKPFILQK